MTDHSDRVRGMLAAAGMPASEEEIAGLAAVYPHLRAAVDALYADPALRYVQPALHVQAEVRLVPWYEEDAPAEGA
jgi:hypothetical protein